jgi:hypothetical protein
MIRFIYFCMAVVAFSFAAIPVIYGIAGERAGLTAPQLEADTVAANESNMTYDEIYALADQDSSEIEWNESRLNEIAPAAGMEMFTGEDRFSRGFTNIPPAGL